MSALVTSLIVAVVATFLGLVLGVPAATGRAIAESDALIGMASTELAAC